MPAEFAARLQTYAEVILRVGLNLEKGQRLLVTDPYELHGIPRSATQLVEALRAETSGEIEIIWGSGMRLREFALRQKWDEFAEVLATNTAKMESSIRRGDALLFLYGSQPDLMLGVPPGQLAELRQMGWEYFGPLAQQLMEGATNWTVAPSPSTDWADVAFADLPTPRRTLALWDAVFDACRVTEKNPSTAWMEHLQSLEQQRMEMNARRFTGLRYRGPGTDLTVRLPAGHIWCSAQLTTAQGRPFVANLPTEEIFTAPLRFSANGQVRVARPINYAGVTISGIELEFHEGRVVKARAQTGAAMLQQLLATDAGAARLGEVALVPTPTSLAQSGRFFQHPLLDENAGHHIALGNAYAFCQRPPHAETLNQSLIHVDLPLDADVTWLPSTPF